MVLKIHQAKKTDRNLIKQIMLYALQSDETAFTSSFNEYNSASETWWDNYLANYVNGKNSFFFLGEVNNEAIGMIGLIFNTRERSAHVASIVWFWVKKEYRGFGFGKQLLKYVIDFTKTNNVVEKLNLFVTSNQKTALRLYRKNKFKIVGKQKKELKINGVYYDYITMERLLK